SDSTCPERHPAHSELSGRHCSGTGPVESGATEADLSPRRARLRFALDSLEIERHCAANEIFQGLHIDLVAFVDVDGAPDFAVQTRVEETCGVLQAGSLGKCHLDGILVRLSRADDAVARPDGSRPLPLFNDLRVCLVNDLAHLRERLPAPVSQFPDLLVY